MADPFRRYVGRSFTYYLLRTTWLSIWALACVVVLAFVLDAWWFWALLACLNVPAFAWNVRAAYRAWKAIQAAGVEMARLQAQIAEVQRRSEQR